MAAVPLARRCIVAEARRCIVAEARRCTVAGARGRTAAVVAVAALLLTVLVPGAARAADSGAEAAFVAAVNQERAAAGLPVVAVATDLVSVARQHAVVMADSQDLHHNPDLAGRVSGWQKVGENVGKGPSVAPIQQAFMASPGHRANVLDPAWTEIGLGVEARDGRLWVVEVFRQPEAAPAAPPAPAAPEPAGPEPAAPEPEPAVVDAPAPAGTTAATPATTRATTAPEDAVDEPSPEAPAGDRALVMLARVADDDAALDAS